MNDKPTTPIQERTPQSPNYPFVTSPQEVQLSFFQEGKHSDSLHTNESLERHKRSINVEKVLENFTSTEGKVEYKFENDRLFGILKSRQTQIEELKTENQNLQDQVDYLKQFESTAAELNNVILNLKKQLLLKNLTKEQIIQE